jgi:hypothetical protein
VKVGDRGPELPANSKQNSPRPPPSDARCDAPADARRESLRLAELALQLTPEVRGHLLRLASSLAGTLAESAAALWTEPPE